MEQNQLFPVFFRLDRLKVLVVGGGHVGTEKMQALFKSSPNAFVVVVAPDISNEITQLASQFPSQVTLYKKKFESSDLDQADLVIAATADHALNRSVWEQAKQKKVLANIADTPELCDFYLGSIVTKGDLKIAISTNGKSPTLSKRIREMLEEVIPDSVGVILDRLKEIRDQLKGDFESKIKKMDEITGAMKKEPKGDNENK